MTRYQELWLEAFIHTQIIEVSVGLLFIYILGIRGVLSQSIDWKRDPLVLFIASGLTHPPLWFILPNLCKQWGFTYSQYLWLGEGLVTLFEGLWYTWALRGVKRRVWLGLALSVSLNYISYSIGAWMR